MKYRLNLQYKVPHNNGQLLFTSQYIGGADALRIANDLIKTNRFAEVTFSDENDLEWSKKEFEKLLTSEESEINNISLYFDGGFNKENLETGVGIAIYYEKNGEQFRIRSNELLFELKDSNEAEYAALYYGLTLLEELDVKYKKVNLKGDSKVVLNQLAGEWACYEKNLNDWLDRIEKKISSLKLTPNYKPIKREDNKEAHKLASQALEKIQINSQVKL